MQVLTPAQAARVTGGGDINNYVKSVATTLTREGGALGALIVGLGLLGTARIIGVAAGSGRL